jgi:hypothetical protein
VEVGPGEAVDLEVESELEVDADRKQVALAVLVLGLLGLTLADLSMIDRSLFVVKQLVLDQV